MGKVIIDTDILIDFLRGKQQAKDVLDSFSEDDIPCCSVITVAEIRAGMHPGEESDTMSLLNSLEHLVIDKEIALLAGKLKQETVDRHLELDDCFIAAAALHYRATLLTHNPKHYFYKGLDIKPAKYI